MLSLPTPAEIKAQRARLGLTQQQVADAAGVSQSMVARVEGGSVDPTYSTLRGIVQALNEAERRQVRLVEIMTTPVASVSPETPVREAVQRMQAEGFSQLPVLDQGAPVGSLSEREVVQALARTRREDLADAPVREVMGAPFPAVAPEVSLDQVLHALEEQPAVLVMEKGTTVGIVTKSDLLHTLD